MTHLGTFRKARNEPIPAGVVAWLLIIGYVVVALCCTAAVIRLDQAGKIQAQEERI